MICKVNLKVICLVLILLSRQAIAQQNNFHQVITPTVTQKETEYSGIVLQAGDIIHVEAGGCVQTGGRGLTTKRYVNPSGENADRLYHGLISIPA
jgi:hypothetical protein